MQTWCDNACDSANLKTRTLYFWGGRGVGQLPLIKFIQRFCSTKNVQSETKRTTMHRKNNPTLLVTNPSLKNNSASLGKGPFIPSTAAAESLVSRWSSSRNLNGFSLVENLLQKGPFTAMLLHRPAKVKIDEESWRHSFQVDSLIHLAGDLFILDMYWPMLPVALVWDTALRKNNKLNYSKRMRFLSVLLEQ